MTEGAAPRLQDALEARARDAVTRLDADACLISRALGDVLIIVAQHAVDGANLDLGQGFLVSDYPATQRVLVTGEPCALTVEDSDADEGEARLLRELGFATLLMLRFEIGGAPWGLVEIYRRDVRPFGADAVAAARTLASL